MIVFCCGLMEVSFLIISFICSTALSVKYGGYLKNGYIKNPLIFGDDKCKGKLPETSLNKNPVGNCAEVDAVNNALNSGAELSHLHLTTIHVTKSSFGKYKESCENCTYAFRGRVKKNYSGWKEGIKPWQTK